MRSLLEVATNSYLVLFIRILIASVLLAAGIVKLSDRHKFIEVVRNYKLLPQSLVGLVGHLLPIIEIIVSLALLLGLLMPWPMLSAICLFLLFSGAVSINLLRGRSYISCGCFGSGNDQRLSWALVIRNVILAGLTVLIWAGSSTYPEGVVRLSTLETVATALIAGATLASWLLWRAILTTWRLPNILEENFPNSTKR